MTWDKSLDIFRSVSFVGWSQLGLSPPGCCKDCASQSTGKCFDYRKTQETPKDPGSHLCRLVMSADQKLPRRPSSHQAPLRAHVCLEDSDTMHTIWGRSLDLPTSVSPPPRKRSSVQDICSLSSCWFHAIDMMGHSKFLSCLCNQSSSVWPGIILELNSAAFMIPFFLLCQSQKSIFSSPVLWPLSYFPDLLCCRILKFPEL